MVLTDLQRSSLERFVLRITPSSDVGSSVIEHSALRIQNSADSFSRAMERNLSEPKGKSMDDVHDVLKKISKSTETANNKFIDAINLGFARLEKTILKKGNEDMIKAFFEAIQPLVDQNVEKLKIMTKKDKKVETVGGGAISSVIIRGFGSPKTGRKTVATPGTAVPIVSTSLSCRRVDITALPTNSGYIFIGDKNVSAVTGSEAGNILYAGNTATLSISDAILLWIDSQNANDGISYSIFT